MSYRKLEIWGQEWKYKVGKSYVDIRDPNGRGYRPTHFEVQGPTLANLDETHALDPRFEEIRPAQVREYIMAEIGLIPVPTTKPKKPKVKR